MYDSVTWGRVVPANYVWNFLSEDQLLDNMQRIWDNPANCAMSHLKAGISQLEIRGILTSDEAASCLKETLRLRAKAKREALA